MEEVVPIRTEVEVRLRQSERDEGRLDALAERYAVKGPVRRLREALARRR